MEAQREPTRPGPLLGGPNPRVEVTTRRLTLPRRIGYAILAPVVVLLIRLLWASYRFQVVGDERARELVAEGTPLILTLWHDCVFLAAWYFQRLGRLGARITYLISPSLDGELGVRLLALVRGRSVRGSATRSGVKAMRDLYRAIVREGGSPVILPDGPRGPRHECKPGSLLLAQMAGVPIQPIACAAARAWRIRTWDRHLVPWPFSRVVVVLGEPIPVAQRLSAEELEAGRAALERRLEALGEEAARLVA